MNVAVVIPTYNEKETLPSLIEKLFLVIPHPMKSAPLDIAMVKLSIKTPSSLI